MSEGKADRQKDRQVLHKCTMTQHKNFHAQVAYMDGHMLHDANLEISVFTLLAFEEIMIKQRCTLIYVHAYVKSYVDTTYCINRYMHVHHTYIYTDHAYGSYRSYIHTI
jgi:hypothetical protein